MWHHVAFVKRAAGGSSADVDLYYDGAIIAPVVGEDTWTGVNNDPSTQMRIGFTNSADRDGNIKNYVQHSTALTAPDIAVLYSIGKDGDYSDVLSPLACFPMNNPAEGNVCIDTAGDALLTGVGAYVKYISRDKW